MLASAFVVFLVGWWGFLEVPLNIDAAVSCGCAGISGDSVDTMNWWALSLMIFGFFGLLRFSK